MKIRPNTWDHYIVNSVLVNNEYGLPDNMAGMVVVDIGAHIGSFALACIRRNAKRVICYEPDPENFEILVANLTGTADTEPVTQIEAINAAMWSKEGQFICLRKPLDHDGNLGRNTGHIDIFGVNIPDPVPSHNVTRGINEELARIGEPIDIIKLDCEGAEWSILDAADLSEVKEIKVELHNVRDMNLEMRLETPVVVNNLTKQGFTVRTNIPPKSETGMLFAVRESRILADTKKPRVLWVGDAGVTTGYGRVTDSVCTRLVNMGWDVHVLGIGYNGDPHNNPYKIYPAVDPNTGGQKNGMTRIKGILERVKPDVILIQDDHWNVGIDVDQMALMNVWAPIVGYVAVDSENVRNDVATQLRNLKHIICHTDFGVRELKKGGYSGPISVAGHGVDTAIYDRYDKKEARSGISSKGRDMTDAFIWGCVGANQPRKRLDLTIAYFAAWYREAGRPDNAYLYIHTNQIGVWDLRQLADFLGVRKRVLLTEGGPTLPDTHMPSLYNAFDVLISTSEGESWGLTHLESMACGIPNIAVQCAGLASWAKGGVLWVPPSYYQFTSNTTNTLRWIASEKDFIGRMAALYNNTELRQRVGESGYQLARTLNWEDVAAHFDKTFRDVLNVQKMASKVQTDALAEF